MGNTQSVIVYRNAGEAAFWESGMVFPLMAALFVGFVVMLISCTAAKRLSKNPWGPTQFAIWVCFVLATIAGCLTFYFLF